MYKVSGTAKSSFNSREFCSVETVEDVKIVWIVKKL